MYALVLIAIMTTFMWLSWNISNELSSANKKCCLKKNCDKTLVLEYYWWISFITAVTGSGLFLFFVFFVRTPVIIKKKLI